MPGGLLRLASLEENEQKLICKAVIGSLRTIKGLIQDLSKQTHNTSGSDLHNSRDKIQSITSCLRDEIDAISKIVAGSDSEYYNQHFGTVYLWLSSMYVELEGAHFVY